MDCFNYPLDTKTLRRKRAKIYRELSEKPGLIEKKIAVLGGSTTNDVVDMLSIFLLNHGIKASFYQSEYGQYWQDAMFGSPELDEFNPDIIYIHTSWRNITDFPQMDMDKSTVDDLLESQFQHFETMWKALEEKFHCPIIQNNFDRPNYRLMGNRDIWDYRGRSNFISRLNQCFYDYANNHTGFYINDIDYLAQDYGLSQWNDAKYWHMYKCAMNMDAIPYVAQSVASIIKSIYGRNKKVLALDLDNTLWGGIVGDDGVEGIAIGPEVPAGQVYAEFQSYCKNLKDIGVVLAVDSKNDEANAIAGLNHPDGILRPEDFVSIKANWDPKDLNLSQMADELTLGVDSFVFADDNPAEREIVHSQLGVETPAMDGAENYIKILDHGGYFEVTNFSGEDMKKTQMYHAKAAAKKAQAAFADYGQYLDSLEMKAYITGFEPIMIQRVAQLTNKSNQFNLTTLRCSEDDIRSMQESGKHICMAGKLVDKFADNGIVTVVAGEIKGDILDIKLWLMSCRVLKRGMEDLMMNQLIEQATAKGVRKIVGHYYPTAKNAMVKDFYESYGFTLENEDTVGNKTYTIEVSDYEKRPIHINL